MRDLWKRINHIVPEPKCRTKGDKIIEWSDDRAQPSESELLSVDILKIDQEEKDRKAGLKTAKKISKFKSSSINKIYKDIDSAIDAADDLPKLKVAIKDMLKEIIIFSM